MIRRHHRGHGDRGTTLVDLVVGLFLTTLAGGLIAHLLINTAQHTASDTIDHDIGLAADVFTRDVHDAERVEVDVRRGTVVGLDLHDESGLIRWRIEGSDLTRQRPADQSPRVMASGLTPASAFALRNETGASIAPDDADAVRWCTRLVVADLAGEDGWTLRRTAALRIAPEPGGCP